MGEDNFQISFVIHIYLKNDREIFLIGLENSLVNKPWPQRRWWLPLSRSPGVSFYKTSSSVTMGQNKLECLLVAIFCRPV